MPDICSINCHFGKLPPWFLFFAKSASTVKTIDFYVMTDDPDIDNYKDLLVHHGIKNVYLHTFTINDLNNIISKKFGIDYKMPSIRKICDFKTAYNVIFEDVVQNYSVWGHNDTDVIFGDVDSYLDGLLEHYDIVSADKNRLCGVFNLYKNTLGPVFKLHPAWQNILLRMDHVAYDEIGLDKATKADPSLRIRYGRDSKDRLMQNYGSPHTQEPLRLPATWSNGSLIIDGGSRETMLIHLGNKKQLNTIEFNNSSKFRITDEELR